MIGPFEVAIAGIAAGTLVALTRTFVQARPRGGAEVPRELDERLRRMEQSLDAIAVEVERVSEGQRFTTRLLAERGDGAARPQAGQEVSRVR